MNDFGLWKLTGAGHASAEANYQHKLSELDFKDNFHTKYAPVL
jgi:hypothetical protein